MRGLGVKPNEIRDAIIHMDEKLINIDVLAKLMDFSPTEDEQRMAEKEAESNNPNQFGAAEHFFYQLYDLIELPVRLKLWFFKLQVC